MTETITETFDEPGEIEREIPAAAENIYVELEGAGGGASSEAYPAVGGDGGAVEGYLPQAAGSTITIRVGGGGGIGDDSGGYNGGGSGQDGDEDGNYSGGGGGASDIRIGGTTLDDRVAVAAGGGGAGVDDDSANYGGDGGGLEGDAGDSSLLSDGEGGTQTEGGDGGGDDDDGGDGTFGHGGDGGPANVPGGAGGGGWYGGGGGNGTNSTGGAGGGGSSYIDDLENGTTSSGDGAAGGQEAGEDGEDGSVTITFELDIDPATDVEVVDEDETSLDKTWTVNQSDSDGQRIYRDTESGVDPDDAEQVADLDSDATAHTDTDLLHGTEYHFVVETYIEYAGDYYTAVSDEAAGTTILPDVDQFTLDASETETLIVQQIEPKTNAGDYRIRWMRAEDDEYGDEDEALLAHDADPLEYAIESLLAGEEYDVGVRTETDDVTGTWHTATEVTILVPVSDLAVDISLEDDNATLTWTNEVSFDGSHQIWRRREDYEYDEDRGVLIDTVATTDDSYVDDPLVQPERNYTYTVRSITQYVSADTDETTTTDSVGLAQHSAPPRGWHAEVDHPSGRTVTPQILDDAQLEPRLRGQPEARIPVPHDETLFGVSYEGAPMRVWRDGERRPVDEVEDVADKADRTVLIGVGATQLERRIQADVVDEPVDELVERLIADHTDYVANVDAPDGAIQESVVQEANEVSEWQQILGDVDLETIPVGLIEDDDGAALVLQRSNLGYVLADEFVQDGGGISSHTDDMFAVGQAYEFSDIGDYVEIEPHELGYTIPGDDVRVAGRLYGGTAAPEITLSVHAADDDTEIASTVLYESGEFITDDEPAWYFSSEDFGGVAEWDNGDLVPDEYYIRLEATSSGDGETISIDMVSLYDGRYEYVWDDETTDPADADPYLDGPEPHPDSHTIRLDPYPAILSVRGGEAAITIDDTSGDQAIAISNDGATWIDAQNADSVVGEFDELTGRLMTALTLSRYGDAGEGQTPRYGVDGQRVDDYTLEATLDETPVVTHRSFDGDLADVLTTIAEDTDSLWEARQDGDQTTIEWAQPGQRESDDDPAIHPDYSVEKHNRRILKATVIGGRTAVSDETVEADLEDRVELDEQNVIPGSERVTDDDGTTFRPGIDYDLYAGSGDLEIREGGDIDDAQTLVVDYDHNVSNSYAHDEYDGDARTELVEQIPQASTERACGQVAKVLVDELSAPRWEADVTIPSRDAVDGLIEALDLDEIPGDAMSVYEIDESPDGLRLRLGNRSQVSETVQRIQTRLEATSERV